MKALYTFSLLFLSFHPSIIFSQSSQGCDGAYTSFYGIFQDDTLVHAENGNYYVPFLDTVRLSVVSIPSYCGAPYIGTVTYEGDTLKGVTNVFSVKEGEYTASGYSLGVGSFFFKFNIRLAAALSIPEQEREVNSKPFPNPFTGHLTIPLEKEGINHINILNSRGQNIMSKEVFSSSNVLVNLSKFENGFYIVRVKSSDGTITSHKIFKK